MPSLLPRASALLARGVEEQRFTAAVARVDTSERTLLCEAVGCLDPRDPGARTTTDSIFDLASLTKLFVATAAMALIERGQLRLHAPVTTYLPAFTVARKADVTVSHLLTHSSGLPANFDIYSTGEWRRGADVIYRKLFATPLLAEPGRRILYSCLGFLVLGKLIETVMEAPLDHCLEQLITHPAGWQQIWYNPPPARWPEIAVTEYTRPNRGALPRGIVHDGMAFALGGVAANAGLFASVQPVASLGRQMLGAVLPPSYSAAFPVAPARLRAMTRLAVAADGQRRGLGWALRTGATYDSGAPFSDTAFGHTGFTGTSLWIDPVAQVAVTLLTNRVFFGGGRPASLRFNTWRAAFHQAVLDDLRALAT